MIGVIARRELTSLFRSPLAWALLCVTQIVLAYRFLAQIELHLEFADKLRALKPAQFYEGPSYPASVQRIRKVLGDAHMGLQVYLAGTEGLIGQAMNEAVSAGIPASAIQTEHRGSVARRMQCVHCKGITEDVMTDPFVCSHCGLNLFVRDHYSRRLAAFQGVCIDAEDPGNVPAPVELYK